MCDCVNRGHSPCFRSSAMEYTHVDISIPLCGRASLHALIQKVSGVVQNAIQDFGLHDVGVGISICQVPLHVAVLVVYDLVSVVDQIHLQTRLPHV